MNTIDVSSIDIDRKRDAQRRGAVAQLFRTWRTGKNGGEFNWYSAKTKKSNFFLKKIASRDTSTKITYSDNFEDRQ